MEEVGKDRSIKSKKQEPFIWKGQSSMERGGNLFQKERELWEIQNKICSMSSTIYSYGKKGWLCNGTQIADSSGFRKMSIEDRGDTSQRPQSREQRDRKLNVIQEQQRPQTIRSTISKIEYMGKLFCPTVSTGAFRSPEETEKVFITGNSGFPKATDISKQLDKGHKRKVIGDNPNNRPNCAGKQTRSMAAPITVQPLTEPATEEAKLWNGWKSHGLKPAYEPILVAMKPNDGSYAENALKWGVSGLNIDGGRISHNEPLKRN